MAPPAAKLIQLSGQSPNTRQQDCTNEENQRPDNNMQGNVHRNVLMQGMKQ
jgi:hypothetical protein